MAMRDPLAGLVCDEEPLTRFLPKQLLEPTGDAAAEIGRLLASTSSHANAAFLASLLPEAPTASPVTTADLVRTRIEK